MSEIEIQDKDNNLIIIHMGKYVEDEIFETKLDGDLYQKYMDKVILKNCKTYNKSITLYNYHDKYYDSNDQIYYTLDVNNILREENKLIKICKKECLKEIEFECRNDYIKTHYNYNIFEINEHIKVYFNEDLKSISVYMILNAYIKDNLKLLMDLDI